MKFDEHNYDVINPCLVRSSEADTRSPRGFRYLFAMSVELLRLYQAAFGVKPLGWRKTNGIRLHGQ